MTKTKIKTKLKTKTIISIALLAFIISGLGLAFGIFYNNNYPKSKCKNAFKIIRSKNCQGSNKKYTVVSFCSKNKSIQKLAVKKLKKIKNCYKSYKIIKKKACRSFYNKTIKLYCPIPTQDNLNENINQNVNEPNTNTPNENANFNQNEQSNDNDNVSLDDPIDDEFEKIEEQQPEEQITELENNLAEPTYQTKPGWPKTKSDDSERFKSIISANLNNAGPKEIIYQSLFDSKSTLQLTARQSSSQIFNNSWPYELSSCASSCINQPRATFKILRDRPDNWATQISLGLNNEIISSILKAGPPGFFYHEIYNLNQNAQQNQFWPKTKERARTNLIISNFQNNQLTNLFFGNFTNIYTLDSLGNDILDGLHAKAGLGLIADNFATGTKKIVAISSENRLQLNLYQTDGTTLPNFPISLPNTQSSSPFSTLLVNLNQTAAKEIVITSANQNNGLDINAIDINGQNLTNFPKTILSNQNFSEIKTSAADIDKDNEPEIIISAKNNDQIFITAIKNNSEIILNANLPGAKFSEPLLANLNNDPNLEIIQTIDNSIYIIDIAELAYKQISIQGDPNIFGYEPTTILSDLDNNNKVELISNIGNQINVWELNSQAIDLPWPMPDQNNQRTRIAP